MRRARTAQHIIAAQLDTELTSGIGNLFTAAVIEISVRAIPLFSSYCGLLDPEDADSSAALNSVFDIASITKIFTAVSFMRLVDKRLVALDTSVQSVVPEFAGRWKEQVTFFHLLTHTSGARASLKSLISRRRISGPDDVRAAALESPLARIPGATVTYSDINFLVLGEALERLGQAPLDTVVSREVVKPLQMTSTSYVPPPNLLNKIAVTTVRGTPHDPTARVLGGVSGHAGLFSCARDLTKLIGPFLSDDPGGGFLHPDTAILMVGERAVGRGDRRGLGWALNSGGVVPGPSFSYSAFGHTGFTGTSIWADPTDGVAVVLLTNRVYFNEQKTWPRFNYFRNRIHRLAKLLVVEARGTASPQNGPTKP
jgi:CubicO group peptidase (beta-lactamase class C family)